ncbi:hypothetical protein ACB371_16855, partial [Klebsiella pneumoniae]
YVLFLRSVYQADINLIYRTMPSRMVFAFIVKRFRVSFFLLTWFRIKAGYPPPPGKCLQMVFAFIVKRFRVFRAPLQ